MISTAARAAPHHNVNATAIPQKNPRSRGVLMSISRALTHRPKPCSNKRGPCRAI